MKVFKYQKGLPKKHGTFETRKTHDRGGGFSSEFQRGDSTALPGMDLALSAWRFRLSTCSCSGGKTGKNDLLTMADPKSSLQRRLRFPLLSVFLTCAFRLLQHPFKALVLKESLLAFLGFPWTTRQPPSLQTKPLLSIVFS